MTVFCQRIPVRNVKSKRLVTPNKVTVSTGTKRNLMLRTQTLVKAHYAVCSVVNRSSLSLLYCVIEGPSE